MMHPRIFRIVVCFLCLAVAAGSTRPQSTQSTPLGTVKDSSGSAIAGADVTVSSVEEGVSRVSSTYESGNYMLPDLKPGHYRIEVAKDGFKSEARTDVEILACEEMRQDFTISVGTRSEIVEVKDVAGAINSETPAISDSFDSKNVLELPANYRAKGSTSPLKLVASLPGVQPDSDGKFSVQGGLPFMSETSVDGITTQNAGGNNPLSDAWPSAETITELRVDGVSNNAEFGQPGAITTITKSGTNDFHGGLFQNRALDALAYGQTEKPQKKKSAMTSAVGSRHCLQRRRGWWRSPSYRPLRQCARWFDHRTGRRESIDRLVKGVCFHRASPAQSRRQLHERSQSPESRR